jgi:N-acetylglucosamine kinase
VYGDEGGAFDIVRQAVRAMLREHEGWGAHTALTPALLGATATHDANELLHALYTPDWPRSKVATLAKIVDGIAESGDPVAIDLLNNAAQQLAFLAAAVRRQLFQDGEPSKLAWIGGVFASSILLSRFKTLIELEGSVTAGPPLHGPAIGALLLAYRAEGVRVEIQQV